MHPIAHGRMDTYTYAVCIGTIIIDIQNDIHVYNTLYYVQFSQLQQTIINQ